MNLRTKSLHSATVRTVLPNGVTVITQERHSVSLIAFQIFVRAGSLTEAEYLGTGISHFVEHVIDDGTQQRTRQQIDALIEALGNDSNAYTWRDHTKYYITTTPEQFPEALDVLSDYVQHAVFPEEEVEIQRGVILHELRKDEDEPERKLHTLFYETLYRIHPARVPVGGYPEAFASLTRDDLIAYYRRSYVPDNTILVAVGDFETEAIQALLQQAFGEWPRRQPHRSPLPQEPRQVAPRRAELRHPVEIASLLLGFPTVEIGHPDMYALDMAALILAGGESTRLHQSLCKQKQIAYSVDAWSESPAGYPGVFGVEAELEAEDLETVEHLILRQLEQLCSEAVTEKELDRARTLAESEYLFGLQTVEDVVSNLGLNELNLGAPDFSDLYLARLKAVTPQDVQRVTCTYFHPERVNICSLQLPRASRSPKRVRRVSGSKPVETPDRNEPFTSAPRLDVTATESGRTFRAFRGSSSEQRQARGEPAASAFVPASEPTHQAVKLTLPNGMRLLIARDPTVPVAAIHAAFLGGVCAEVALGDIRRTNGLCRLMTQVMGRSAEGLSAQQIADCIESAGGSLDGFSGHHSFGFASYLLSQHVPLGLELIAAILRAPTFPPHEIEWNRRQQLAQIRSEEDDWLSPAQRFFQRMLFTCYPYRYSSLGTSQAVKVLSGPQLADFHRQLCVPNNMVLAVYGDVEPEQIEATVEDLFGDWSLQEVTMPASAPEPIPESGRRAEQTRPMTQAVYMTGATTVSCCSEEQYAFQVLCAILSGLGYPGGRVHNRLRQEQLVYTSYAYNRFGLDMGFLALCAVTRSETLPEVESVVREEIHRLCTEPVGELELERAKNMCIVHHRSEIQTMADRAGVAVFDELYGLGHTHWEDFAPNIRKVTIDDILRIAQEYLAPGRLVTTVLKPNTVCSL